MNCQSGPSQGLGPVLTWGITSTVILWDSVDLCPSVPEICPRWVTPVDSRKDRRVHERARSGAVAHLQQSAYGVAMPLRRSGLRAAARTALPNPRQRPSLDVRRRTTRLNGQSARTCSLPGAGRYLFSSDVASSVETVEFTEAARSVLKPHVSTELNGPPAPV